MSNQRRSRCVTLSKEVTRAPMRFPTLMRSGTPAVTKDVVGRTKQEHMLLHMHIVQWCTCDALLHNKLYLNGLFMKKSHLSVSTFRSFNSKLESNDI